MVGQDWAIQAQLMHIKMVWVQIFQNKSCINWVGFLYNRLVILYFAKIPNHLTYFSNKLDFGSGFLT